MARCNFCKEIVKQGTGKIFVKQDGKALDFCSMKCEKNMLKLRRNPAKIKWAKSESGDN